jgi:hypothetical protein
VTDGEPGCRPGALVRLRDGLGWAGLDRFAGRVGRLVRRGGGAGEWVVWWEEAREAAVMGTRAPCAMLRYDAEERAAVPQVGGGGRWGG